MRGLAPCITSPHRTFVSVQGESYLFGKPVWNKRWFILSRSGKLRYYANDKATKEKVTSAPPTLPLSLPPMNLYL